LLAVGVVAEQAGRAEQADDVAAVGDAGRLGVAADGVDLLQRLVRRLLLPEDRPGLAVQGEGEELFLADLSPLSQLHRKGGGSFRNVLGVQG
jgi:hypothetical protein